MGLPGSGVACAFNRFTVEIVKLLKKRVHRRGTPGEIFFGSSEKGLYIGLGTPWGEPMAIFATVGNEWTLSGYMGVVYPEMQISILAVVEVFRGEIKAIRA